ncbi:MAG: hydroxymethylbilane synthase [Deltaproteobacteria bacterium]|nr:hydroxymethylbilane synthase [Deltaproteobacteria bacterium]
MTMVIRIGTRGSQLALAQTQWVIDRISAHYLDITVDLVKIKTRGDKIINRPLSDIGGKGLFVKEIEEALQRKQIDVAVHSLKDVPAELPDTLCIGIIPEREDPHDVMLSKDNIPLKDLPVGSCLGTSSLRRAAQILHYRSDLKIVPLRGNLDTRIRKLDSVNIQAIVVAAAGLKRIGLADKITQPLSFDCMLPAIGQGALGLEFRLDDQEAINMLKFLDHYATRVAVEAERSFLMELQGGCQVPIAGFARLKDNSLLLDGLVADLDGGNIFRDTIIGSPEKAKELGVTLANMLLDTGAGKILEKIYGRSL